MTKEIEERVLQAARDHAIDIECPIHDKWWDEWVEPLIVTAMRFQNQLQSKLTQPADVQERAKEYVQHVERINQVDPPGYFSVADMERAYLAGASSLQAENERLRLLLSPLANLDLTGVRGYIVFQRDNSVITVSDVTKAKKALTKQ